MGGKSSSSSSNSTSQETNDQRIQVEDGIGIGAGATVTLTDPGVMAAFESVGSELARSIPEVIEQVTDLAGDVIKDNNAVMAESVEDNAKEIAETAVKWLFGMVAVLGLAFIVVGKK
ncbi:hypothetical protein [Magnetococcus sp. PR-3]|uniref:hypothetical protein n=1 Tax=Magnetococcus sp. PR-3 TaxID=3120355 RepID=UPI002FCDF0E7